MLDDAHVFDSEEIALAATIRAVLSRHAHQLDVLFAGSSRLALAEATSVSKAPMYQFVKPIEFPPLGEEFIQALADAFQMVQPGQSLDLNDMRDAFERIGHKPRLMTSMITEMAAVGATNVATRLRLLL